MITRFAPLGSKLTPATLTKVKPVVSGDRGHQELTAGDERQCLSRFDQVLNGFKLSTLHNYSA